LGAFCFSAHRSARNSFYDACYCPYYHSFILLFFPLVEK
jgi:hypothetical protein